MTAQVLITSSWKTLFVVRNKIGTAKPRQYCLNSYAVSTLILIIGTKFFTNLSVQLDPTFIDTRKRKIEEKKEESCNLQGLYLTII